MNRKKYKTTLVILSAVWIQSYGPKNMKSVQMQNYLSRIKAHDCY